MNTYSGRILNRSVLHVPDEFAILANLSLPNTIPLIGHMIHPEHLVTEYSYARELIPPLVGQVILLQVTSVISEQNKQTLSEL